MSYEQNGKVRLMVRLQLHDPTSASIDALMQLRKEGKAAEVAAIARATLTDASAALQPRSPATEADRDDEDTNSMHGAASRHKPVGSQDSL